MPKHGRSPQASLKEEQLSEAKARANLGDQLVEKWAKTKPGENLDLTYEKDYVRARNAAIALEMQESYFKNSRRLNETTISSEFQTTPENVLRIVRIGTANSNRADIFHEYPMTTVDDSLYFIKKTYKSTKRGATAGEVLHETVRPNYATEHAEDNLGTGNGAATNFGATLSVIPVVPFSIQILQGGVLVGNDNGAGVIVGTGIVNTSTIDYTTGVISVDFSTAPLTGVSIDAEFSWDSEKDTLFSEIGDVNLEVTRKRFNARPEPLGYSYSQMTELTLGRSGLGDTEDMLVRAVGDEHAMRRDLKAVQLGKRVALGNPVTTFNADFAAEGEDSDYNHAQRILSSISDVSGAVYDDIKRGVMNRAVCGSKALTYLKKHKLWEKDTSQPRVSGTYLAGTLDDIKVYATPSGSDGVLATNDVLLAFKNPDEDGDVSLGFGVLTELVSALDYPEFYRRGAVATVESQLVINSKFLRMLTIENL